LFLGQSCITRSLFSIGSFLLLPEIGQLQYV
jgi:hypothetical protein